MPSKFRIPKGTNKLIKSAAKKLFEKPQQKKAKTKKATTAKPKTKGAYYKRKRAIERYAKKALELNETTQNIVNQFKRSGIAVTNTQMLDDVKQRINKALTNEKPSKRVVELIKEYAKQDTYDFIKMSIEFDNDEFEEVNLGEIRKSLRKQVLSPDKISERQSRIISEYGRAMANYANSFASELPFDPDEDQIKQFEKKFKKVRDVAIGGNSTLINDLSYTYDALWEGRKFVEKMQRIMSKSSDFMKIEAWYRSNEESAVHVRDTIGSAIKSNWYSGFLDFSAAILEFIANLPSLSKEAEDILEDYSYRLESLADEAQIGL